MDTGPKNIKRKHENLTNIPYTFIYSIRTHTKINKREWINIEHLTRLSIVV
jgi:wobble nucleotide-excising tRNase